MDVPDTIIEDVAGSSKKQAGRQPIISKVEEIIVIREFAAANAHVSSLDETKARFD